MAAESFELNAESRTLTGKAAIRRLRHQHDLVPAVIYGAGKEPQSITLLHKDILRATRHEAIFSSILTIDVDGQKQQAVFKSIQRHHTKPRIMHIDFQRVKASEKLTMSVPLHFVGAELSPGVVKGGIVSHLMTTVDVRCLPADLPQHIEVDISNLELNESLHLSHLKLPSGVELAIAHLDENHDSPIASVHLPRVSQADIEAEAAEAALSAEASAEASTELEATTETPEVDKESAESSDSDTDQEKEKE